MNLPPAFAAQKNTVHVIIETPRNSRNKFDYDPDTGLFRLNKILPAGLTFPFHFGFIPQTKADDGDPVDIAVMMNAPSYPGIWITCRLLGVIEGEQTEKNGSIVRNDRMIGVPQEAQDLEHLHTLKDMNKNLLDEMINFFSYYNSMAGKEYKPLGVKGPAVAIRLIKRQMISE
jgi:inorganic pyrophosphatase